MLSLDRVRVGQTATVVEFGQIPQPLRQKLLAMGLTPGITIQVVHVAPFGDPLQITLRGYTLSLRKQECQHILVASQEAISSSTTDFVPPYVTSHPCTCR